VDLSLRFYQWYSDNRYKKRRQIKNRYFFSCVDKLLKKINKNWSLTQDDGYRLTLSLTNQEYQGCFGNQEDSKANRLFWEKANRGEIDISSIRENKVLVSLLSSLKKQISLASPKKKSK